MDFSDQLIETLRNQVFHRTSMSSYNKIELAGFIDTNEDSRHGIPFGFSSSYGRSNGYVCLFDLRDRSDEDLRFAYPCLPFAEPHHLDELTAYLLLSSAAFPKLIDQETALKDIGPHGSRDWVPRIECWYPGQLPLDLVRSVVRVDFRQETMSIKVAPPRSKDGTL